MWSVGGVPNLKAHTGGVEAYHAHLGRNAAAEIGPQTAHLSPWCSRDPAAICGRIARTGGRGDGQ